MGWANALEFLSIKVPFYLINSTIASADMDEEDDHSPSPIPTGKGIRSAVDAGSILSQQIHKSNKQVPELVLPGNARPPLIDYQSLVSRDIDSVDRLMRSAAELGVFQISGHGISGKEFKSTSVEYEWVFRQLFTGYCRGRDGDGDRDRDELVWCHSDKALLEMIKSILMTEENFQTFSKKMNKIARQLEEIARDVAQIMAAAESKQADKRIQLQTNSESVVVVHRYQPHQTEIGDQMSTPPKERDRQASSYEHALCIHFLLWPAEFSVRSERLDFSFKTNPDSVIVTLGQQYVQETSAGVELRLIPDFQQQKGPVFSVGLKCSSSHLITSNSTRKFYLADQIVVVLMVAFLYKICSFLLS